RVAQPGVVFGATTRKPRLSNALAVRDCWSPNAVMGGTGSGAITTRFACCSTVTVRLSCRAPLWARIRAVPLSTARTRPLVVTVAMLGAELVQLTGTPAMTRSEEHTSELQSPDHLVCRLLLEKKKQAAQR